MNDFSSQMGQLAQQHGESMRQQAQDRAKKRKEDYLGARVSKALRERVFQQAEKQDISTSLLIRQVLEKAFPAPINYSINTPITPEPEVVVTPDTKKNQQSVSFLDTVIAWDTVQLSQPMPCRICQTYLPKGENVMLGVFIDNHERPILCKGCQEKI